MWYSIFFFKVFLSPCLFKLELTVSLALPFILKILLQQKIKFTELLPADLHSLFMFLFFLAIQSFVCLQITYETNDRGIIWYC